MASYKVTKIIPTTSKVKSDNEAIEFDYAFVRIEYFRKIRENPAIFATGPLATKPYTKISVNYLAKGLRSGEIQSELYEILTENDKDILIAKRNSPSDPIRRIIAAEDAFEIILSAHISTNHGAFEPVLKSIQRNYSVPKGCINFVLLSCNVCFNNRIPSSGNWHLTIAPIYKTDVNNFRFILFYKDDSTNYVLLKPLINKTEKECVFELFKIFSQFGPPKMLWLYGDTVLFNEALTTLSNFGEFDFLVETSKPGLIEGDLIAVIGELTKWMNDNNTNNWVIGCHIVQWKLNTTRKRIKRIVSNSEELVGVPYELMFGSDANVFKYLDKDVTKTA